MEISETQGFKLKLVKNWRRGDRFFRSLWWWEAPLVTLMVKSLPAVQETRVRSLGREDPLRRKWQSIPVFLPRESHGQRSLAGYSPWGHKELDTAEWISLTLTQVSGEHDFKYLLYHYGGMWPRQACQTLLFFIFSLLKWEGGRCEDRALLNLSAWETYLKNHSLNSRCVQSL